VEGFESNVINGGMDVFMNGGAAMILTESNEKLIMEKGEDPVALMKKFREAGYRAKNWMGAYMSKEEMETTATAGGFGSMHDLTLCAQPCSENKARLILSHLLRIQICCT